MLIDLGYGLVLLVTVYLDDIFIVVSHHSGLYYLSN